MHDWNSGIGQGHSRRVHSARAAHLSAPRPCGDAFRGDCRDARGDGRRRMLYAFLRCGALASLVPAVRLHPPGGILLACASAGAASRRAAHGEDPRCASSRERGMPDDARRARGDGGAESREGQFFRGPARAPFQEGRASRLVGRRRARVHVADDHSPAYGASRHRGAARPFLRNRSAPGRPAFRAGSGAVGGRRESIFKRHRRKAGRRRRSRGNGRAHRGDGRRGVPLCAEHTHLAQGRAGLG